MRADNEKQTKMTKNLKIDFLKNKKMFFLINNFLPAFYFYFIGNKDSTTTQGCG